MPEDAALERELDRLRAENLALNEQVKLLVQTEQRLYRFQIGLDVQLDRLRALARFALESSGQESPRQIAHRAMDLLAYCFTLDWMALVSLDAEREIVRLLEVHEDDAPAVDRDIAPEVWGWMRTMSEPCCALGQQHSAAQGLWSVVEALAPDARWPVLRLEHHVVACLPLAAGAEGPGTYILVAATRRRDGLHRLRALEPQQIPFLQLLVRHLDHEIASASLTKSLRERSEELARSVESLERTQQQLLQAQKLEAVGRLAGGVAHDFNNLLTVILGYGSTLAASLPANAPQQQHVRRVQDAAGRAARITGQLLALGRRQMLRQENFDLSAQADSTLDLLRRLVGEHIVVERRHEPGLAPVRADRAQFEQVLLNLVVNARDAMPSGGVLRIRTRRATPADGATIAGSFDPAAFAVLVVEDDGIGMDESTRARIFEPFFTTKSQGQGSGLGLAVVYGIVKQSGGHIVVESSPGQGARFSVLLPIATGRAIPAPTGPPEVVPAERPGPGARVLVVEDEEAIRDVISESLRRHGFQVHVAIDGQDALEQIAREGAPDLVLTDVQMPRLGGAPLAERLRADHPHLPVAFMSGYSEEQLAVDARRDTAFLSKPFSAEQLVAFVRARVLARRTSAR